jgi:hypothetical protein
MNQAHRDRLVALKKAKDEKITRGADEVQQCAVILAFRPPSGWSRYRCHSSVRCELPIAHAESLRSRPVRTSAFLALQPH